MRYSCLLAILLALAACQSRPGEGGLYVYTDARGNLVTLESGRKAPEKNNKEQAGKSETEQETLKDPVSEENYRTSDEVDAELEAKERDRFVTYVDGTGQLVSKPLDMVAEKNAAKRKEPGFETLSRPPFLETYRALRQGCCRHLLENTVALETGQEVLVKLDESARVIAGKQPLRAMALEIGPKIRQIDIKAFIRDRAYIAAQLLWLDDSGTPALLVDQPFTRRYPETWHRYSYLQGTLPREEGRKYLVVFLPYTSPKPATDGLTAAMEGELLVTGR